MWKKMHARQKRGIRRLVSKASWVEYGHRGAEPITPRFLCMIDLDVERLKPLVDKNGFLW